MRACFFELRALWLISVGTPSPQLRHPHGGRRLNPQRSLAPECIDILELLDQLYRCYRMNWSVLEAMANELYSVIGTERRMEHVHPAAAAGIECHRRGDHAAASGRHAGVHPLHCDPAQPADRGELGSHRLSRWYLYHFIPVGRQEAICRCRLTKEQGEGRTLRG